jgi:Bacteriophage Lambda NinG protein
MKCKSCGQEFVKVRPLQRACSPSCALWIAQDKRQTDDRKQTKAKLAKLKPRAQWMQEAQAAFNAWIRYRDKDQGCISCGTRDGKKNAGHYYSVGAKPELRFEPLNVHLQCERCNTYLHGNLIAYREGLVDRIGRCGMYLLEQSVPAKKYTVDDLKSIKEEYKKHVKNNKNKSIICPQSK